MSLATRCTVCGTVFRVVQDQLKVSEGWVRCGRCGEVFNAIEGLFDLERDTRPAGLDKPVTQAADASQDGGSAPSFRVSASRQIPVPDAVEGSAYADTQFDSDMGAGRAETEALGEDRGHGAAEASEAGGMGTGPASRRVLLDLATRETQSLPGAAPSAGTQPVPSPAAWAETRQEGVGDPRPHEKWHDPKEGTDVSVLPADDLHPAFADAVHLAREGSGEAVLESERAARGSDRPPSARRSNRTHRRREDRETDSTPDFVRRAQGESTWTTPRMRVLLALGSLVLAVLLAGQVGLQFHDRLAAQWPALEPALALECRWLGCDIQAPRNLDAVTVDSVTLARLANGDDYRLTVVLRNSAGYDVSQPHLDLVLTGADGTIVTRRVISPADFRVKRAVLPQRSEIPLQLPLSSPGRRIVGYTVAAFYP